MASLRTLWCKVKAMCVLTNFNSIVCSLAPASESIQGQICQERHNIMGEALELLKLLNSVPLIVSTHAQGLQACEQSHLMQQTV